MNFAIISRFQYAGILALGIAMIGIGIASADESDRIQPFTENPRYWQYNGEPVLLLGGSKDDNLFQIPDLEAHLDEMRDVGANYIRNSMSDRADQGFEVSPFLKNEEGKYDLEQWNEVYWQRFENLIRWTAERDIIVQIELWDKWDMHAEEWTLNPWNPTNNINYTHEESGLKEEYARPGSSNGTSQGEPHDFFLTVLDPNEDGRVLAHQKRFVDKLLSYSLNADHVLYCISNEIHPQYPPEWGWFWASYLKEQADKIDRGIEVSEMFWSPDFKSESHRASLDRPDVYSYFEASQNSAVQDAEENWNNLLYVRDYLREHLRPINNTKIYGADEGPVWAGNTDNAQEKFWRSVFGGAASARFHRPPTGLGLSPEAKVHIRSARMMSETITVFACEPNNDLLRDREANETYCLAEVGKQYAIYFPKGGEVSLDVSDVDNSLQIRWLDVANSVWKEGETTEGGAAVKLKTPESGPWIAVLKPVSE